MVHSMKAIKRVAGLDSAVVAKPGTKAKKQAMAMKRAKKDDKKKEKGESKEAQMNRLLGGMRDGSIARSRLKEEEDKLAKEQNDSDDNADDADAVDSSTASDATATGKSSSSKAKKGKAVKKGTGSAKKRPAASISGQYEAKGWRDRSKMKAMDKLMKRGELPADVQAFMESKSRGDKTSLVNKCIKLGEDGKYQLCLDDPIMNRVRSAFESQQSRDRVRTVPKIKAESEWGSAATLARALADGQAWEVTPGTVSWREGAADHIKGSSKITSKIASKKLDKIGDAEMERVMDAMGWQSMADTWPQDKKKNVGFGWG
jgi:hypothetical protein